MILSFLGFLACSLVIFYCGSRLTKYGDYIGEKTGLGRTWIGTFLVASVTSLPELFTGLSSVLIVNIPNFAVGNVLGACIYNLLLIAVLDSMTEKRPISSSISYAHLLSITMSTLMLSVVATFIYLSSERPNLSVGWISPATILIITLYFVSIRLVYLYDQKNLSLLPVREEPTSTFEVSLTLQRAVKLYVLHSLGCIFASLALPELGLRMTADANLKETFVGTFLLSLSTTLPEMVVTFYALRAGAVDLAVGNIFGSILFNLFILAIDDLFYLKGPLLAYADSSHLLAIFTLITMQSILVLGMVYSSERKHFLLAWDTLFIMLIFWLFLLISY